MSTRIIFLHDVVILPSYLFFVERHETSSRLIESTSAILVCTFLVSNRRMAVKLFCESSSLMLYYAIVVYDLRVLREYLHKLSAKTARPAVPAKICHIIFKMKLSRCIRIIN